ncbi:MAG: YceD family protein [Parvularculaceae bacterium]
MTLEPEAAAPPVIVEIAALGPGENHYTITVGPGACADIAARLGEPGLERLQGDFTLTPFKGGLTLDLRIIANANRLCVVSLEPMTEEIDERYTIRFERGFSDDIAATEAQDEAAHEPLETDALDLTEILIQHLSLSLDPHPRKPGATSLTETYRDAAKLSPFAVLDGLVDDGA